MASRWMAPKLAKLRRPYTDDQLLLLDDKHRAPAPEVLDAIADRKLDGGYAGDRHPLCGACFQRTSANGACGCEMYTPAPPRTLPERQAERRAAAAVQLQRDRRPAVRQAKPDRAREYRLAQMGLR